MKTPIHLNALRAFEASARHQSFSAAAAELNVSPAAVGQLVRTLEDWVGAPLFHRHTAGKTRLVATQAAERALHTLADAAGWLESQRARWERLFDVVGDYLEEGRR